MRLYQIAATLEEAKLLAERGLGYDTLHMARLALKNFKTNPKHRNAKLEVFSVEVKNYGDPSS